MNVQILCYNNAAAESIFFWWKSFKVLLAKIICPCTVFTLAHWQLAHYQLLSRMPTL